MPRRQTLLWRMTPLRCYKHSAMPPSHRGSFPPNAVCQPTINSCPPVSLSQPSDLVRGECRPRVDLDKHDVVHVRNGMVDCWVCQLTVCSRPTVGSMAVLCGILFPSPSTSGKQKEATQAGDTLADRQLTMAYDNITAWHTVTAYLSDRCTHTTDIPIWWKWPISLSPIFISVVH